MAVLDMHTDGPLVGRIKLPARYVTGAEEWRVRCWQRLVTWRGEWGTDIGEGVDYRAIFDGQSEALTRADVIAQVEAVPGTSSVDDVEVVTEQDGLGGASLVIRVRATYGPTGESVAVEVGA